MRGGFQSSGNSSESTMESGLRISDYHTTGGVQSDLEDSYSNNNQGRPLAAISEMNEVEDDNNFEHR